VVFAVATLVLIGLMLGLELLVRRRSWNHEVTRRIAHVLACLYGIVSHSVLPLWLFVPACSIFVVVLVLSRRRGWLAAVHITRRASLGEIYLPAGIIIGALAAGLAGPDEPRVFAATILILALADVAAGVTGDLLHSPTKTWWGSTAFFLVAVLVANACGFGVLLPVVVALATTVTERLSSRGTDNLTVPLVGGLLLALVPL
jgi:dolichol kinase